ncbi:MAG: hypothetical protein V4723_19930 [Pseudomonadota bacterium]
MIIDLATRRPIRQVTRADLQAFPVWEWAVNEEEMGGHGESFIRPTQNQCIPTGVTQQYIVAAVAILNDGSHLPAVAEVSVQANKVRVAPLLLFLTEHRLDFYASETLTMLSHFTRQARSWPARWELAVAVEGETRLRSGRVRHGFARRCAFLWARLRSPGAAPA